MHKLASVPLCLCGFLVIAACSLLVPRAFGQATPSTRPVTPAEQAQFAQRNAAAQMQELERRMFHLAELVRQTEPGDSARLLLGVRKAREQLIVEQMKEVIELLGQQKDLGKAADDQKQLIAKLEELKKLLLASENDLILQLSRSLKNKSLVGVVFEQRG